MDNKIGVLEGLLFVVGDDGLTFEQIMDSLEVNIEEAKELVLELKREYESDKHGIQISMLGDKLKLTTKKEHKDYYQKLILLAVEVFYYLYFLFLMQTFQNVFFFLLLLLFYNFIFFFSEHVCEIFILSLKLSVIFITNLLIFFLVLDTVCLIFVL